ncbi:MAG: glycerophosphodiester phosphodiesterase family protein [Alphaproteobacteria bacterium]|nr:glycerophosphodiester phosphodiesterase family protein [Alphaproteobacteria bacterium]
MKDKLFARPGRGPFISAHRGFSEDYPENTIPALAAALEAGADVAEIDIKLTRDGKLVLMHDTTVDRTTNGTGAVKDLTLAEIRQLDAGSWFGTEFSGTIVPTLDEVIAWSSGRLGILLEMKNCPERDPVFLDEVIATIERHAAQNFVFPAGFDHPSIAAIHARRPDWSLEIIMNCRLCDTVQAAKAAGAVLVSLEPEYAVKEDVEAMHAAGLSVLTTLLSIEHGRELFAMGIDFFEANDVGMVVDTFKRLGLR